MSFKPLFVLSFCGISLFTYDQNTEDKNLLNRYTNFKRPEDIEPKDLSAIRNILERRRSEFFQFDMEKISQASAELNGTIQYYNGNVAGKSGSIPDQHILLCTDTWLGESAANLVNEWLNTKPQINSRVERITDLQTENPDEFQIALTDLVNWCNNLLPDYHSSGYHIVFNLTAGFKAIQGFLQTLAVFYADETVYIFERSKTLLKIPRLPLKMQPDEAIQNNLTAFRRLANGLHVDSSKLGSIQETLIMSLEQQYALSTWGTLVWNQTRPELYKERLWDSPSEKIKFGDKFQDSLAGLEKDRLRMVNEKIDDLAVYLENKTGRSLTSLDFKPLQGNPKPPCTHEMDAWHDGSAMRLFGYYQSETFLIDHLGKALH